MPRYYFNIENGDAEPDEDGTELSGPEQARTEGIIFAGAYLRDNPELIEPDGRFVVEVRDAAGAGIARVIIALESLD